MLTTLNKIRYNPLEEKPCRAGWEQLLKALGKTKADDEALHLRTILDINGLDDAIWCLRAVEGYDREIRLFAVWCARRVQHLMTDQRSLNALDVSERYANGQASAEELKAAREAAWEAKWGAAWDAAGAAAWEAARAAWHATRLGERAAQEAELRRMLNCTDNNVDPYPYKQDT
jgi:hypothetical protein